MTTTRGSASDRLAGLEEERDHLLRSIEDLDAEFAAGDLDEADYRQIRDDYTARAATVLRAIDETERSRVEEIAVEGTARRSPRGLVVTIAVIVIFVAIAAVLVLRASSDREAGEEAAVSTGDTTTDALVECRDLAMSRPEDAIACYDEILTEEPDDVAALTYKGWAQIQAGDVEAGLALIDEAVALDGSYPDAHVFRAIVLAQRGEFEAAQSELDAFYALDPPPETQAVVEQEGLAYTIAVGLLPENLRDCWTASEELVNSGQSPLPGIQCLDAVIAAEPADYDALLMRGWLLMLTVNEEIAPEDREVIYDSAAEYFDRAAAADPDRPEAHLLKATLLDLRGEPESAKAELDEALELGEPSALYASAFPVHDLQVSIEAQLQD
ncbi:MAG: hypothetical protein JJLCMIEE_03528 [Acidimicrobiales bacterium]|nr:MAG: hypothetical protein EDR02_15770 [Actinomycetota bacterium]MBV6510388.1 hypothetical protein [Acidimicrobiales bacterium]RIK03223.1 MAG: hypothetical protein DCC48_17065 [Acidobacteriota bacterium]